MPIELKIPHIGESITEVQIAEWLKAEGDLVKRDEPVAVIDSEKTTLELPAPENGRLTKIFHQAGETIKIGEVIAHLEPGDSEKSKTVEIKSVEPKAEAASPVEEESEKKENLPAVAEAKIEKPTLKEAGHSKTEAGKPVEPIAKKTLIPDKIESKKNSSGPELPPTAKSPADREEKIVPMTMLRRTAAKRLVEAKQQMAMLTTFNEVDLSAVQALRQEYQEAFWKKYQIKLGLMSFFVKAVVDALQQFPQLNAEIRGNDIVYHPQFDIGVAIASERGLVVPILRNAEHTNFAEIEKIIGDFARRAKDGKLKPEELEGGTFTITNGGVFGSLFSTPIINPPQAGILGMHAIQERPIALQGQVVIRPMMYVALTYDHRIVDGREAVLFLQQLKETIEKPSRLLIGI